MNQRSAQVDRRMMSQVTLTAAFTDYWVARRLAVPLGLEAFTFTTSPGHSGSREGWAEPDRGGPRIDP
jgi:hypothetical protein